LDEEVRAMWETVVADFESELEPHFLVEEQVLLPALDCTNAASLAERTRSEHAQLRAYLSDGAPSGPRLHSFGTLLRDHVRFEENELFPAAETLLDDAALDAVARASRQLSSAQKRER
jgi:hemerythrin-like domain-containing protein